MAGPKRTRDGMKQQRVLDNADDQARVTDGYFASHRHGSGICKKDLDNRRTAAGHGLLHGWSIHAAAAESVEPLWEGRGQGWLHGLNQKRANYLSSSEDTGDAPLSAPASSCSQQPVDEQGPVSGETPAPSGSPRHTQNKEDIESQEKRVKVFSSDHTHNSSLNGSTTGTSESNGASRAPFDHVQSSEMEELERDVAANSKEFVIEDTVPAQSIGEKETNDIGISHIAAQEDCPRLESDQHNRHVDSISLNRYPVLRDQEKSTLSFEVDDLNCAIIKRNDVLFRKLAPNLHLLHAKETSAMSPLICACRHGDASMVETLLKNGAPLNIVDQSGKTPLILAIERGDIDMVKILLDGGADVCKACDIGLSALHYAVKKDTGEITKLLINAGSPLDYRCPDRKTALMKASASGKVDIVLALVASGSSVDLVDDQGRTALISCLAHGIRSQKILSALIEAGTVEYLNKIDFEGKSALVHAITHGMSSAAEKLLKSGCEFKYCCRFSGKYPLILAIEYKLHTCVSWMLQHGADPDCSDMNSKTALMYAAELGYGQMVADLINAGACTHLIDEKTKFSALDYAAYHGHKQSARILLKEEGKTLADEQF